MRQVKELLAQMRNSYRKLKQDGKNILEAEHLLGQTGKPDSEAAQKKQDAFEGDGVGQIQEMGEFGLGVAPRDSRPVNKIELTKEKEAEIADAQAYSEWKLSQKDDEEIDTGVAVDAMRSKNKSKKRKYVDKQSAYMEYKKDGDGLSLEESIKENRQELNSMKGTLKELTESCNSSMKDINMVKAELDRKQDERKQNA